MTLKSIMILALLFSSLTQAKQKDEQFELMKYGDSIFVLVGKEYGTNIGVIASDKGLLLIDPMAGEKSFNELHSLVKGIASQPISYVANTHNHEDHTGGNEYFSDKGATILYAMHESDSASKKSILVKEYGIEVTKVTSHTTQDFMYYNAENNVLFVGDVFDNSWHPTFYAGGINGFNKTIDKILAIGDESTVIIPGHGAPAYKEDITAFYESTIDWLKRVSALHKEELSVEQIMKDEQINEILQRFNTEKRKEFIPKKAFRRFIERTISIVSSTQYP